MEEKDIQSTEGVESSKQGKRGDQPDYWKFKPGQSGNPRGRPKGARTRSTFIIEALTQYGKSKNIPNVLDKILFSLIQQALKGDRKAIEMILDGIFGRVPIAVVNTKEEDEDDGRETEKAIETLLKL